MADLHLGFDIGGSKCAVVLASSGPRMLGRRRFATADCAGPDAVIARLIETGEQMLTQAGERSPQAIGIACGGPLDAAAGLVLGPPNLPGWDRVALTAPLAAHFHCPARLENDADAGALAEWRWGAGRGCRDFVFLTMGTGFGSGLILGGRLHRGASGAAGEIGHCRLADQGPEGYGKRGSCEGFCSGGGIGRWAQESGLPWSDAAAVFAAADAGERRALELVAQVAVRLGHALALLVDLLNPERIAIGGIFARRHALLWPLAREALAREGLGRSVAAVQVVPAELGESIGDFAALAVAQEAAPCIIP